MAEVKDEGPRGGLDIPELGDTRWVPIIGVLGEPTGAELCIRFVDQATLDAWNRLNYKMQTDEKRRIGELRKRERLTKEHHEEFFPGPDGSPAQITTEESVAAMSAYWRRVVIESVVGLRGVTQGPRDLTAITEPSKIADALESAHLIAEAGRHAVNFQNAKAHQVFLRGSSRAGAPESSQSSTTTPMRGPEQS